MMNTAPILHTGSLPTIGSIVFWNSLRFIVLGYELDDILLAYLDPDPAHRWEQGDPGRLTLGEFFAHHQARCLNCDQVAEPDAERCAACEAIAYCERQDEQRLEAP